MKKKKKVNIYKNDNRKIILIFVMMLCIAVAMFAYWIYAYHNKYGYLPMEKNLVSYKIGDYLDIEGNKVFLKNIDKKVSEGFLTIQDEVLKNAIIDTDITKGIYNNVLSIKIDYTIKDNNINYEKAITLNYDLKKHEIIENDDLLEMAGKSYKDIATEIFDDYIKLSDLNIKIVDAVSDKELTGNEFNNNREKYIIRIREKLPDIIDIYIDNKRIYYTVALSEINSICYYVDKDNTFLINKEIGKI